MPTGFMLAFRVFFRDVYHFAQSANGVLQSIPSTPVARATAPDVPAPGRAENEGTHKRECIKASDVTGASHFMRTLRVSWGNTNKGANHDHFRAV